MVRFLQGGLPLWMLVVSAQVVVQLRKAMLVRLDLTLGFVVAAAWRLFGERSWNRIMCVHWRGPLWL